MNEEFDLPEIFAGILLSDDDELAKLTVDDFYDFVGISKEDRTDFGTSAIMEQAIILTENIK